MSTASVSINGTLSTARGTTQCEALAYALYGLYKWTTDRELRDDIYRVAVLLSEGDARWGEEANHLIPRAAAELIADATGHDATVSIDGREGAASPVSLLGLL